MKHYYYWILLLLAVGLMHSTALAEADDLTFSESEDSTFVTPADTAQTGPVDSTQIIPVDTTQTVPVDTTQIVPVDTTQAVPVDTTQIVPVDTTQVLPIDTLCIHNFRKIESVVYCSEEGYTTYICTKCDSTYTDTEDPIGHILSAQYTKITNCEQGGSAHYICSRCDHEEDEPIAPTDHNYTITSIPATCIKEGSITHTCRTCGYSYIDSTEALGHNYVSTIVAPTIQEEGYTLHKCTRCSESYKDNSVEKMSPKEYFKGVHFSEVMPCNTSTYINTDNYNFSGYIEFVNESNHKVDLTHCVLSHHKLTGKGKYKEKWEWEIAKNVSLKANDFSVVWMDEEAKYSNHAPYKLDVDGGYITLRYEDLLIDSLAFGSSDAHVSYGRYENSEGYMSPSPFKENTFVVPDLSSDSRCKSPLFSAKPGVLSKTTNISLSCATPNALIYYTLDGTEPSATNGLLYSTAIPVSENTNIRAVATASGKLPSKPSTGSYIFEDKAHKSCGGFSVPIVSITIDKLYYDDPMVGMFETGKNGIRGEKDCQWSVSNVNRDWKRPLNFEYIVDGEQVLSQEVESAIMGGCSRQNKIKSISLKASKKTGIDSFDYHFFASKPDLIHKTLHLRNGGTAYSCVPFRDGLMQTLGIGMNLDYQAYQPVAYYMNGKYVGMMALNERTNADYVTANHGVDEDKIDLIVVSDQLGISASRGDMMAYNELVDYLNMNNPNSDGYYERACERMDMDEYIDYQIIQQFVANKDWPGNNTKIWRKKKNGIFRWILFDTDYGLDFCQDWEPTSTKDMIKWCRGEGFNVSWANQHDWMVNIFRPLSDNEQFKRKFTTKFLMELSTRFNEERINAVFDSITALVSEEYCAYMNIDAQKDWDLKTMRAAALDRSQTIYSHLNSYVKEQGSVNFSISSNLANVDFVLNGEPLRKYKGKYIAGYDFDLKAIAPEGYKFLRWETADVDNLVATSGTDESGENGVLSGKLLGEVSLYALFGDENTPTFVVDPNVLSLTLYPNPAKDYITVLYEGDVHHIVCFDMRGSIQLEVYQSKQLDIRSIPKGFYMLKVETDSGVYYQQFVKQ